jgi:hypothetical protein
MATKKTETVQKSEVRIAVVNVTSDLAFESPSTQVLRKCGFTFTEELFDPDDGILWQWKLPLKPVA